MVCLSLQQLHLDCLFVCFLLSVKNENVILLRIYRDAKYARNEGKNEMNAKIEFAAGAERKWRHPKTPEPAEGGGGTTAI